MNRRELLKSSAALGFASTLPTLAAGKLFASASAGQSQAGNDQPMAKTNPLTLPPRAAFLLPSLSPKERN
jgi:hypothetical protein